MWRVGTLNLVPRSRGSKLDPKYSKAMTPSKGLSAHLCPSYNELQLRSRDTKTWKRTCSRIFCSATVKVNFLAVMTESNRLFLACSELKDRIHKWSHKSLHFHCNNSFHCNKATIIDDPVQPTIRQCILVQNTIILSSTIIIMNYEKTGYIDIQKYKILKENM